MMSEKLTKGVEELKGKVNKTQLDLQLKVNQIKKQAADADRERLEALKSIEFIKKKIGDIVKPGQA